MAKITPLSPGIRSIDVGPNGNMLVGTRGSDVVEITGDGKLQKTIVQGHFDGKTKLAEVWGCAAHPTEQLFASCGSDKTVRTWEPSRMVRVSQQF
jgi:WD40 repeat protein